MPECPCCHHKYMIWDVVSQCWTYYHTKKFFQVSKDLKLLECPICHNVFRDDTM